MKQYQDERTLQVRNRIYAELMRIMLCVVVLSFCIKTLYFHMDLAQCMTEYILMILAPVYQAVRIRQTEVVLGTGKDSSKRATPLLLLLLLIPFFLRRSEIANGNFSSLLPPVVFIVLFLAVWYLFSHAEEKRAERLENAMMRRTKSNKIGKKRKKTLRFPALYGNLF